MMMRQIILLASGIAILVSCSQKEPEQLDPIRVRPIKATSFIEGINNTKAVVGTDEVLGGVVFVRIDDPSTDKTTGFDFSSTAVVSGSRAVGGAITFVPEQLYEQSDGHTAYLRGYHPAGALSDGVVTWAPDGATDILLSEVWNAGRYVSPLTSGLTFCHRLSRLEVICQAEIGSALSVVQAMWGDIESIKFVGAKPLMTYTYATDVVDASGTAADFTLLNGATYTVGGFVPVAVPANANTTVTASAMLPPVASTSISLKVKTANVVEKSIAITLDGPFAKAQIHKVTLTFKANGKDIEVAASTIEGWTNGSSGNNDVTDEVSEP